MTAREQRTALVVIDPKAKTMERFAGRVHTHAVYVEGPITAEKVETFRTKPSELEMAAEPELA